MSEANQVKWVGVRPVNPEESLPVKRGTEEKKSAAIKPGNTVAVGAASTTICAANTARVSFYIENIGSNSMYVYLGTPATVNHLELAAGDFCCGDNYTGIITGIVAAGAENAYVVEV